MHARTPIIKVRIRLFASTLVDSRLTLVSCRCSRKSETSTQCRHDSRKKVQYPETKDPGVGSLISSHVFARQRRMSRASQGSLLRTAVLLRIVVLTS